MLETVALGSWARDQQHGKPLTKPYVCVRKRSYGKVRRASLGSDANGIGLGHGPKANRFTHLEWKVTSNNNLPFPHCLKT